MSVEGGLDDAMAFLSTTLTPRPINPSTNTRQQLIVGQISDDELNHESDNDGDTQEQAAEYHTPGSSRPARKTPAKSKPSIQRRPKVGRSQNTTTKSRVAIKRTDQTPTRIPANQYKRSRPKAKRVQRVTSKGIGGGVRKKRRYKPGTVALREIRSLQKSVNLICPKAPFRRLVRELVFNTTAGGRMYQVTASALEALQEAAEAFLTTTFEKSNLAALHAKRVTLMQKDMVLIRKICDGFLVVSDAKM